MFHTFCIQRKSRAKIVPVSRSVNPEAVNLEAVNLDDRERVTLVVFEEIMCIFNRSSTSYQGRIL